MPTTKVKMPSHAQALRQPQPPMRKSATSGMAARPVLWLTVSRNRARGRRRMNQLLMAVVVPSSRGLAKAIRPGTYRA